MTRRSCCTVLVLASALIAGQPMLFAHGSAQSGAQLSLPPVDQDALARAKALYASAEFEAALQMFQNLRGAATSPEAEAYQAYCLVALGRRNEAKQVIEQLVQMDPMFHPQEGQLSPHLRTFFDETRKPLLMKAARQAFTTAKSVFDGHDMPRALAAFDRVIAILDEVGPNDQDAADLRAVSVAFRDIARAARPELANPNPAAPPAAAASSASSSSTSVIAPPVSLIYDAQNVGVVAPIPLSTPLPDWRPTFFELNRTFTGDVELVIAENGSVISASITRSVHERYDGPLIEAAKTWTFKPAMKGGTPVRYRYVMTVRVLK